MGMGWGLLCVVQKLARSNIAMNKAVKIIIESISFLPTGEQFDADQSGSQSFWPFTWEKINHGAPHSTGREGAFFTVVIKKRGSRTLVIDYQFYFDSHLFCCCFLVTSKAIDSWLLPLAISVWIFSVHWQNVLFLIIFSGCKENCTVAMNSLLKYFN